MELLAEPLINCLVVEVTGTCSMEYVDDTLETIVESFDEHYYFIE